MTLALLAALIGAVGYGVASVLQAVGTTRAAGLAVLSQPMYLAGLVCDALAWLASLVALRHLPLFAVQSLLAGSLAVTVLLARFALGTRLRRRDVVALPVVGLMLVALAVAAGGQSTRQPPSGLRLVLLVGLILTIALAALTYRSAGAGWIAAQAGLAFSGAALATRAAYGTGGWTGLLGEPLVWAVLGYGAVGVVLYARALEHGAVGSATAILWVVQVAIPAAVGVTILHDGVRPGWAGVATVALPVALTSCVVLATGPAAHPEAHPSRVAGV